MDLIDDSKLRSAMQALGALLERRRRPFDLAVIGGSGLLFLDVVRRTTKDVDIVGRVEASRVIKITKLPAELEAAARAVAAQLDLPDDWLNAGPSALLDFGLPSGFLARCEPLRFGKLTLHVASRFDQIHFKVYATSIRGRAANTPATSRRSRRHTPSCLRRLAGAGRTTRPSGSDQCSYSSSR